MIHYLHIHLHLHRLDLVKLFSVALFLLFFIIQDAFAQQTYQLHFNPKTKKSKHFGDSVKLKIKAASFQNKYLEKGFLNCQVDTIEWNANSAILQLELNTQYYWNKIHVKNKAYLSGKILQQAKKLQNKAVNLKELDKIKKNALVHLENNGYPFAKILIDSTEILRNSVNLKMDIDPGALIRFDSLHYTNNVRISKTFMSHYLGIQHFSPYNEQAVKHINNKIEKLNFLEKEAPFELTFSENKARIQLNLTDRKTNQFNGIIGFQPAQEENTLQFTGQFYVQFVNAFKIAESIEFEWNKLEQNSQELMTNIAFPFMFLGNFGMAGNLYIEKFDSTYLSTRAGLSLTYAISHVYTARANSKLYNSNLLIENTNANFSDFTARYYGIGFTANTLNNSVVPEKGFKYSADFNLGKKEIPDTAHRMNTYELISDFDLFLNFFKPFVFSYGNQLGIVENDNLSLNEFFKLGGIKTIRGFNEKSLLTSSYMIQSIELAYHLESNTRAFLFYDHGLTDFFDQNNSLHALGTGITIETQAGLFSIIYALGKQNKSPFLFKNAKIHFGYISRF